MTRTTPFTLAAVFAALLGAFGILGALGTAPARAAGMPAGTALTLDQHSKPATSQVYHRHWHRPHVRYPRRHVYRPYYYRPAPIYYRRCVTRPRIVWTPYGYVRRYVRVCR